METKRRSLIKALSWRVWATLMTMLVSFIVTRELSFAVSIGLLDTVVKFTSYFVHERVWSKISYGVSSDQG